MNELTAAVGLAQLKRFPTYLEEYNDSLAVMNDAVAECVWLRSRTVPKQATQSGYVCARRSGGSSTASRSDRPIQTHAGAPAAT